MTSVLPDAVALVAFDGVNDLDLFGAHAVLTKATELAPDRLSVRMLAPTRRVVTSCGVEITIRATFEDLAGERALVVPGGSGADVAARDQRLQAVLRSGVQRGARLYGVCSGVMIIAGAGFASGRRVAIHHDKRDAVSGTAEQVTAGMVRDGLVCTVGGDLSPSVKSVDMAWRVLFDLLPAELVHRVGQQMEIVPGREVEHLPDRQVAS